MHKKLYNKSENKYENDSIYIKATNEKNDVEIVIRKKRNGDRLYRDVEKQEK